MENFYKDIIMYRQIENLVRKAGEMMLDAFGKVEAAQEKTSNSEIPFLVK